MDLALIDIGSRVDEVAYDQQAVTGCKSLNMMDYLKESAAQIEILQLQSCQTFHVQLPSDLSGKDVPGLTSAAMQPPDNIIDSTPKVFSQENPGPEFTHDNYQRITSTDVQDTSSTASLQGVSSSHGNQVVSPSLIPDALSTVIIMDEPLTDGQNDVGCHTHSDSLQAIPQVLMCEREHELTELTEAPQVFYVKTLHEATQAVRKFEQETGTKYSAYKNTAGFGSTVYDPAKPHKIYFEERSTDACCFGIPYDGIPFMSIGNKVMDCQYGMDRSIAAKRRYMERHLRDESRQKRPLAQDRTKKIRCRAQIRMKEILKYADFKVSDQSSSRKERVLKSKELREALRTGTATGEKRIYIQVPRMCDHNDHPLGQDAVKQVKPNFSGKQATRVVNSLSWDTFITRFGNVIEHGGMAASTVWSKRPFANVKALHSAFGDFVDDLSPSGKSAMFRCYPSLLADVNSTEGALSTDCINEFKHLGLDTLSTGESCSLADLDNKYRRTFQFSFIICMQETDKEGLWTTLLARSRNTTSLEIATASKEVKRIAWYRILDQLRIVGPK